MAFSRKSDDDVGIKMSDKKRLFSCFIGLIRFQRVRAKTHLSSKREDDVDSPDEYTLGVFTFEMI